MTAAVSMSVVEISVAVEIAGQLYTTRLAGSFDALRSAPAARGAGRQIGEMVGECLALRIQHGGPVTAQGARP